MLRIITPLYAATKANTEETRYQVEKMTRKKADK